jgi:hypothetical protein
MCAIDALGMAAMLGKGIEVRSSDPVKGQAITVWVNADGIATWEPAQTVVLAGSVAEGPSFNGCCAVLNFFVSPASLESYLQRHPDVQGMAVSVTEAAAVGTAVFGQALGPR